MEMVRFAFPFALSYHYMYTVMRLVISEFDADAHASLIDKFIKIPYCACVCHLFPNVYILSLTIFLLVEISLILSEQTVSKQSARRTFFLVMTVLFNKNLQMTA